MGITGRAGSVPAGAPGLRSDVQQEKGGHTAHLFLFLKITGVICPTDNGTFMQTTSRSSAPVFFPLPDSIDD
jgi:hypothetical protein